MGRPGTIAQLTGKLERIDDILTRLSLDNKFKESERLLNRYHELWDEIEGWVKRNPDYEEYKGFIEMEETYRYILKSIKNPIDIDNFEDNLYW